MDFINHHRPIANGRNHDGFGHTHLARDERSGMGYWIAAAIVVLAGLAVVL